MISKTVAAKYQSLANDGKATAAQLVELAEFNNRAVLVLNAA